jgi:hypothetical protein
MIRRLLALALLALAVAGCGTSRAPGPQAQPSPQLTDLRDISELRSAFNARSGEPRLILLVSPT